MLVAVLRAVHICLWICVCGVYKLNVLRCTQMVPNMLSPTDLNSLKLLYNDAYIAHFCCGKHYVFPSSKRLSILNKYHVYVNFVGNSSNHLLSRYVCFSRCSHRVLFSFEMC